MPKLAAGVIGAGSIGNVHLTGYAAAPQLVQIQAIAEINPKRLTEMGEKYKVPVERRYKDYKEMLSKEKLDLCSICVPNVYHYPCAAESIKAGVNTLMEKPMVLTNEQAKDLKKIAARKKVKTMVAFSHRFHGTNIAAKKVIDKGAIGKPFMIRVRYAHGGPYPGWAQSDWFYSKKLAGGGALLDMGIHAIDICQHFVGPIKTVTAHMATLRKKIEVDDNAVLMLDFGPQAKCLGYIEVGWTSGPGFTGIEMYGDKANLTVSFFGESVVIRGVTRPDGTTETVKEELKPVHEKTHWEYQMQQWINYVAGKKTIMPMPGIEEGASSLAVALGAIESSKTGKRFVLK
jgi:UDP-N-acetylglucosamine 3-dehydrogenase